MYLDYNATTPVLPAIWEAARPFLFQAFGNPSSGHWAGKIPTEAIEKARGQVAHLIHASPNQIYFTSGGTESNHLALLGALAHRKPGHLAISHIEHPAILEPAQHLASLGWQVSKIPVDKHGQVSLSHLKALSKDPIDAVSVMLANNETGVLQPVQKISQTLPHCSAYIHTDAAQAVGKISVNVTQLQVDTLSIAGHKLYAPKGVGALYVRDPTRIQPLFMGGGQEKGLRPGTQNVAYIVALGAACKFAQDTLNEEVKRLKTLRTRLFRALKQDIPKVQLNGAMDVTLPNTLSVRFPDCHGNELLDLAPNIAASTGAACHEGLSEVSQVILAMGISPESAKGTVRLSLGRLTTTEDVDIASHALIQAWKHLTKESP